MPFDIDRIRKSVRRVSRFVRNNSKRPSSNGIHNLRTSTRTLETTFLTLGLDSKRQVKRLLRHLREVRKRAGKVRDMDVLTADALKIPQDGEQDCLVQLIEYLGAERRGYAKKLRVVIRTSSPRLRRDLKGSSRRLEKLLQEAQDQPGNSNAMPATIARAIELSSELNSPARLNKNNLHEYRLKVKELRDVLQLSTQVGDQEFVEKLGDVKDAIGEWHDSEELIAVAARSIDHGPTCGVIKHLKATSNSRYEKALSLTNLLRRNYLKSGTPKRGTRRSKAPVLSIPVLRATSAIAQR
jgi:CHAD domain-containing protein